MNIFRFLSFIYARENFNCYVQVMFSKIRMFCILAYVNCFANDCFFSISVIFIHRSLFSKWQGYRFYDISDLELLCTGKLRLYAYNGLVTLFFILMQGAAASYNITVHYCDM